MNIKLPKPSASLNTAAQCREIGIQVGDTIEGRETHSNGSWNEARLTLLWLGDSLAVWRQSTRSNREPEWTNSVENANWTLQCREWKKVGNGYP